MDRRIKAHQEVMQKMADTLGLPFEDEEQLGLKSFLGNFKLFKLGGGKVINNVIRHRNSDTLDDTIIFDYKYIINTGKSAHVFRQTVYAVYCKTFALPHFYMFPEKWYHRFGKIFGFDDIDFVSYPKFSHNYYLKSDDEEFTRHSFDQTQLLSLFGRKTGYSLEGCNYVFVLYKHNKLLNYPHLESMIRVGERVTQTFFMKGLQWMEAHQTLLDEEE